MTFDRVQSAYCRICDNEGAELARYVLREARGESGLLIARLFREPGVRRWGFQAVGTFCKGNTWKDSVNDMRKLCQTGARTLQLSHSNTGFHTTAPSAVAPGTTSASSTPCMHGVVSSQAPPKREQECVCM